MAVRDHLKRIGKKQRYNSLGELADCSTFYSYGTPKRFISKFDRVAQNDSIRISEKPATHCRMEFADCSASYHPSYGEVVKIEIAKLREIFSTKTDVLINIWTQHQEKLYQAHLNFVRDIFDPHYTNPRTQKCALQFAQTQR